MYGVVAGMPARAGHPTLARHRVGHDWLSEVQDAPGTAEHYQRNDCANHEVRA